MSDLRDECIEAIDRESMWNNARGEVVDAVLRVVESRLLSDEAVEAAEAHRWTYADGAPGGSWANMPAALSAAWRVVTGSNHE
jgi:hypothetical protein